MKMSLQTDQPGQTADVRDLVVAVEGIARYFVATSDEGLVLDLHVVGRHQVVTEAGGHMQDVFRAAVEVIEHVLKRRQTWFVGLCLFGSEDFVKRCTEFFDVGHDLAIAGGVTWRITQVKAIAPAGVAVLYDCNLRK